MTWIVYLVGRVELGLASIALSNALSRICLPKGADVGRMALAVLEPGVASLMSLEFQ